jgi:hypothetical protein
MLSASSSSARLRARQVACRQNVHPLAVQHGDELGWPLQLLAQSTRTTKGVARLGRTVPLCGDHRFAKGNLKIKFMLRARYALGQVRNQRQARSQLPHGFNKRRAFKGSPSGFAPPFDGRFGKARLCEVNEQGRQRTAFSNAAQDIERGRISPMHILKCQHHQLSSRAGHDPIGERCQLSAPQHLRL